MKRVIYDRPVNHRNNSMKHQIIYTIDHTPCKECFSDHSNAFGFSKSEHHRCAVSL